MGIWAFVLHLGNFALPALLVAALLSPGVIGWKGLAPTRATLRLLLRTWALLAGAGLAVLVAGLAWFGRDGKMASYAALALVTGSLAFWLQRRQSRQLAASARRPARR